MEKLSLAVALALLLAACEGNGGVVAEPPRPLPSPTRSDFRSKQIGENSRFWPRSALVERDVSYRFNTGHCGLGYLTDFDGSFWHPINPNAPGDPPQFFFNEDSGTMTLRSDDTATYESSDDQRVRLRRLPGPETLKGLCA